MSLFVYEILLRSLPFAFTLLLLPFLYRPYSHPTWISRRNQTSDLALPSQ